MLVPGVLLLSSSILLPKTPSQRQILKYLQPTSPHEQLRFSLHPTPYLPISEFGHSMCQLVWSGSTCTSLGDRRTNRHFAGSYLVLYTH